MCSFALAPCVAAQQVMKEKDKPKQTSPSDPVEALLHECLHRIANVENDVAILPKLQVQMGTVLSIIQQYFNINTNTSSTDNTENVNVQTTNHMSNTATTTNNLPNHTSNPENEEQHTESIDSQSLTNKSRKGRKKNRFVWKRGL